MMKEMLKQFDANSDGQLDETEKTAMRERLGSGRGRGKSPSEPDTK